MAEIKISEKLGEKLGENDTKKISFLAKFEEDVKNMMENSNCPGNMMEKIVDKITKLTEVIAKIENINARHISNDEKKEKIQEELGKIDLEEFKKSLNEEIIVTKLALRAKGNELNKTVNQKADKVLDGMTEYIDSNIELLNEEKAVLKGKENDSKEKNKEIDDEIKRQNSLPAEKKPGFFSRFFAKKKEKSNEPGFFRQVANAFIEAYKEVYLNKEESISEKSSEDLVKELISERDEIDNEIYKTREEMGKINEKISKLEAEKKKIEETIELVKNKTKEQIEEKVEETTKEKPKEKTLEEKAEVIKNVWQMSEKYTEDPEKKETLGEKFKNALIVIGYTLLGPMAAKSVEMAKEKEEKKVEQLKEDLVSEFKKTENLKVKRKEAVEKMSKARESFYESREDFDEAKENDMASKEKNLETKEAKKIIKGISSLQKIISGMRYKNSVKKAMKASDKVKKADKKLKEVYNEYENHQKQMEEKYLNKSKQNRAKNKGENLDR